jgi:diguanylate cyclase (GGDEF)-like protein
MSAIARFDIRTLLACLLMLALVFSGVFLAMKLAYRNLQGIGSLSLGFLSGAVGLALLASRGHVPDLVSVVVGHTLILTGCLLLYRCVLLFPQRKMAVQHITLKFRAAATLTCFAILGLIWFTEAHDSVMPRLAVIVSTVGIQCGLIAYELLRAAGGRLSMHLFALFMAVRSAGFLYRVASALLHGALPDFMKVDSVPVAAMAMGLLSVSLLGIFFLVMLGDELTLAVEHRASLDPLTGSLNRHAIELILAAELERARRNHHPLSAILIDVDRFKNINDAGGHAAGDAALRTVALGLAQSLRSYDLLGRYGGDEFLLLLPETSTIHALEVAHRVQALLAQSVASMQVALRPTVSMGIAETMPGDTPETLVARADAALYDAKHAGRNCVRHRDTVGGHPIPAQPLQAPSLVGLPLLSLPLLSITTDRITDPKYDPARMQA